MNNFLNNNSDRFIFIQKIILYIFPVLALIAIIYLLILGKLNYFYLGSYIAIPMFFAPIIYSMRKKNIKEYFLNSDCIDSNSSNPKFCADHWFFIIVILYILGFSISITILSIFEVRPYVYYGIMTLLATFILLEILKFDVSNKVTIILMQIILFTLNIIWGVTLKYYYFIGRTDPIVHVWYIFNLLKDGHVTGLFDYYQYFPLWHIMVSSTYMILNMNLPIQKMMFIINGLNYAIMIVVIYLISLKIFKDKRLALMSALFTSINSDMIVYGMSSIPRSVVTYLEAILILLILDLNKNDIRKTLLVIFLTFAIIIYHTASMPYIIIIFLIIYMAQRTYTATPKFLTSNYLKLAIIMTMINYLYYARNIFEVLIKNIFTPAVAGVITKSVEYDPLKELFNYIQLTPLLFFILIGLLLVLESQKFSGFDKIFCLVGFLLVGITFPGPALLLNKLAANFNLERFGEYSLLFIVIVAAIGFTGIYYGAGRKLRVTIIILFVSMTLLSISNDFSASDNPLVKRVFYTFYLKEEEIVAFDHMANITTGYVMSDYVTLRYLQNSPYLYRTNILEIYLQNPSNTLDIDELNHYNNENIEKEKHIINLKNSSNDNILIREDELKKRPLRFFPSTTGKFQLSPSEKGTYDYYYRDSPLYNNLETHRKIYDSGAVSGYN